MFPEIDWIILAPIVIVFLAGIIGVITETFVCAHKRYYVHAFINNIALISALGFCLYNPYSLGLRGGIFLEGELLYDLWGAIAQLLLLVVAILSYQVLSYRTKTKESYVFISNPALKNQVRLSETDTGEQNIKDKYLNQRTEYFPLLMFSLGGMLTFVLSNSFLTLFVSLEIISLPLYVLAALNKHRREISKEGAVKYFLMGSFASAFMLMGMALIYGMTGTFSLSEISEVKPEMVDLVWAYPLGMLFMLVGFLFKIGVVPFHAWTPDTYQGAPTAVTGFMAALVKIAGFFVLTRFVMSVDYNYSGIFNWVYWTVIILTILVGTFAGLVQNDVKRLLAYSSIAHSGFLVLGVFAVNQLASAALIFYLFTYGVATIGVFTIVSMLQKFDSDSGELVEDNSIEAYSGLAKTNPMLAFSFLIFLLSYAGIPLTAGFIGKFMIFSAAVSEQMLPLVILGVIASLITAFYYLRIVVLMFTGEKQTEITVNSGINMNTIIVFICLFITVICGLFPNLFFSFMPLM